MKKLLGLLALAAMLLTSVNLVSPAEADALARRDRTLEINWCWGATEVSPYCPTQTILRKADGTLELTVDGVFETGTWTYHRPSKTLTMNFDNYPETVYEGTKRGRCFNGTMSNVNVGQMGVWAGCFID